MRVEVCRLADLSHSDAFKVKPSSHPLEFAFEPRHGLGGGVWLEGHAVNLQYSGRAVGLQIDARDQGFVHEERQDIIAMCTPFLRHVDLDPVPKSEQALGARPFPNERIKRCK